MIGDLLQKLVERFKRERAWFPQNTLLRSMRRRRYRLRAEPHATDPRVLTLRPLDNGFPVGTVRLATPTTAPQRGTSADLEVLTPRGWEEAAAMDFASGYTRAQYAWISPEARQARLHFWRPPEAGFLPLIHATGIGWWEAFLLAAANWIRLRGISRRALRQVAWWALWASLPWQRRDVLKLLARAGGEREYNPKWIAMFDTMRDSDRERMRARARQWDTRPRFSLLLAAAPESRASRLQACVRSLRKQLYRDWELCVVCPEPADSPDRLWGQEPRVKFLACPAGARPAAMLDMALDQAGGEFVALLDADDRLAEHALYCFARELQDWPDATLLYSDEDRLDDRGRRCRPCFKSDWDPELLRGCNMIGRLCACRRELLLEAGGPGAMQEDALDWDIALRVSERSRPHQVRHIARVLYHRRFSPLVAAQREPGATDAARKAVAGHLRRLGVRATVEPLPGHPNLQHVCYALPRDPPPVSILIPTRDRGHLLRQCLRSLRAHTSYPRYEILVADNDSREPDTLALLDNLRETGQARVLHCPGPFDFSAICNRLARQAGGEILCLLNNDIEAIASGWLREMVACLLQPGTGAVGAKLYFPGGLLQHAGVFVEGALIGWHACHWQPGANGVYRGRALLRQRFSAVTAACMVVRRKVFLQLGGFTEGDLAVCYNDVDFCLRLQEHGYHVVWTPWARLVHHESRSRGLEDTPAKRERLRRERQYMRERWGARLERDPRFNPNLARNRPDFIPAFPPRVDDPG